MEEIWKPVKDFENLYEVSNLGNIKSIGTYNTCKKGILTPMIDKRGYFHVCLYNTDIKKDFSIHRLVAEAFIPNPDNLPQVNHIDENKSNNCVDNLEWCTNEYNIRYSQAKSIDVYTKDGKFIETIEVIADAAIKYNVYATNISRCCKSEYGTCGGFQFRFHGEPFQQKPISEKQQKRNERKGHKSNESRYIPLYEYTLDGNFVRKWDNSAEAAKYYNIEGTNIRKCGRGEIATTKGRIFIREEESIQERLEKIKNRKHKSKSE